MKAIFKRAVIFGIVGVLGILGFAGCSTSAQEDSYSKIVEQGYLIMGLDDTFAPMGFRDERGELAGFDVDLAQEVFDRMGLEVKMQPIDWTMKETELNSGNIDVIWNGYTITEGRKKQVAFTKPYLDNSQIIITLADLGVDTKADLAGKKVALQNESSAEDAINAEPDWVEALDGGAPVLFETYNECFMDLEAGRVAAVVADEVFAKYYIKQRGPENFKILKEDFGSEEYGIGVRKSDVELLKSLDETLDSMRADGSYDEMYKSWFSD